MTQCFLAAFDLDHCKKKSRSGENCLEAGDGIFVLFGFVVPREALGKLPLEELVNKAAEMSTEEEVRAAIAAKGDQIKAVKAEKAPTMKDDLAPLINELLALKLSFKGITGQDFDPPKVEKKPKGPAQVVSEREGPSKTELNKLAKKAAKEAARAKEREEKGIEAPTGNVAASASGPVDEDAALAHLYGDAELCRSHVMTERNFVELPNLEMWKGQTIWIRARLANSRAVGKGVFLIMRSMLDNVQCILWQSETVPKAMVK